MIYEAKIYCGSKLNKVEIVNSHLKIHITAQPEKGKANRRIIVLLADFFNITKANISIIAGFTSNLKRIKISKFTDLDQKNLTIKKQKSIINKNQRYISKMHSWDR